MKKTLSIVIIICSTIYSFANSTLYDQGLKCLEKNNIPKAIEIFKASSDNGNARAMYKLGLIYEKKEKKRKLAIQWYKKAKVNGNIKAKYNLGVLSCRMKTYNYLDDFEAYAKDSKKSVQYDLAVCFSEKGDIKKAIKWFKLIGEKGDVKAQYRVGTLLKNRKDKIKWLKKSAKNNHTEAQFDLGKLLFKAQQLKKSKYWLRKAKKNGSRKATVYLERMKELGL